MLNTDEIRIRDPFVFVETETSTYYLFGTTDENVWNGKASGFDFYTSKDLTNWNGPFPAFRPEQTFWADRHFWAPEVHYYRGSYYMLASFKAAQACRGTQILKADQPAGPYYPISDQPVTPRDWECLDGTLYVDQDQQPWLVFCWEWLQVGDGKMCALRLSEDLRTSIGKPICLFSASEADWPRPVNKKTDQFVTDGPFLYYENGQLSMLWSSIAEHGYAIGVSRSVSGEIQGPWQHERQVLIEKDGGHGMLFQTLEKEWMLAIHAPNQSPNERPTFINVGRQLPLQGTIKV
ncbi:glycoside hydrolase family 43 protein [Amphibacillus sediminis]|uniref:glycoside hydrolase family 43 protein n=1 Tax=Amphibacillus sediminis TaxID=360185 RepID=UPI000832239B|nr:glycoside hydrolase family 43 protein [Amphibacillus sediminis]